MGQRDGDASSRLARVALGREPADLVVSGGALLNVYTEELLEGWGVAVAGGRVASIGPDVVSLADPSTEVIDLAGDIVAPGLVEGHTHITRIGLRPTLQLQVRAGVSTTVMETIESGYIGGPEAVRALLADGATAPGRVFFTVSPLIGLDEVHDASIARTEEWIALLDEPAVVGIGEIYWADLLRGHPRTEALIAAAESRGLAVEGHGAGARFPSLAALAASGIGDDHEGIDAADLLNRLRLGFHGLARQGATRQDLTEIARLWRDERTSLRRLSLVTDGVEPEDLVAGRTLNGVVEMAVANGLELPTAWRMASLSVAERFRLDRFVGGIAPGLAADLVVISREGKVQPRLVLVGGRPPEPEGTSRYPEALCDTVRLEPYDPALLEHPGRGRWRAMELVAPLVTREAETDGADAIVAILVDRLGRRRAFRGLLTGLGLRGGAVAVSSGWESAGITGVGDRPDDLALAIERVRQLRGGAAVVAAGDVRGEWRAELLGVQSLAPVSQVIEQVASVQGALRSLGCEQPNPLQTIETLTTAAIPHLRLTPDGYVRLRDGARLGLEV